MGGHVEERTHEHHNAVRKSDPSKSTFAKHIIWNNHCLTDNTVTLLRAASKGRYMSGVEEIEI